MTARLLLPTLLLPLALALGCAKQGSAGGSLSNDIEMTGVADLDRVFTQARDIDVRLDSARTRLNAGRSNLNSALGLAQGTPFADALSELRNRAEGKLQVVLEGGTPKLQASDAVPGNVQAAIDSANGALASYQSALADVTAVSGETTELVQAVRDLSNKITTEPGSLGLKLSEIPSVASTTKHNLDLVQNFPNRVTKLTDELTGNLGAASSAGGGGGATAGSPSTSTEQGSSTQGSSTQGSSTSTSNERKTSKPMPR